MHWFVKTARETVWNISDSSRWSQHITNHLVKIYLTLDVLWPYLSFVKYHYCTNNNHKNDQSVIYCVYSKPQFRLCLNLKYKQDLFALQKKKKIQKRKTFKSNKVRRDMCPEQSIEHSRKRSVFEMWLHGVIDVITWTGEYDCKINTINKDIYKTCTFLT